jgi:methylmalonyl-CoA mutase
MAAVIGGTDALAVRPFTDAFKPATDLSERIAKNIQIVIREEAYLGDVIDPSAGSYYIENITDSIITEAWNIFQQVEEQGGYLKSLKKGLIQKDVLKTAQNRKNAVASGKESLLGTNKYPNSKESQKDEINTPIAFPEFKEANFTVTPLYESRAAVDLEQIRLAIENHPEGVPKVFLLTYGNQTMRRARAAFSNNFFACGGYEIIDNPGFDTPEEGAASALKSDADLVVVCSSDEEYIDLAPKVKDLIQDKAILVIAGAPACMDNLKSQGIENFIHLRMNIVEALKAYHKQLGIRI